MLHRATIRNGNHAQGSHDGDEGDNDISTADHFYSFIKR
jgi:hypothetical protein